MQTIWKSVLKPTEVQEIEVPSDAEFLCARDQHEQLCVWYRCDPTKPKEKRAIAICGTGHTTPDRDSGRYIGTGFLQGGMLVFHVFVGIGKFQ